MQALPIILILIGIGFLILEIFIPSFGITGSVGIIAILVGVILRAETFMEGMILFLIILVIAIILMFAAYKILAFKNSPFILKENLEEDTYDIQYFVGKVGRAVTPLRPSGTGEFEGVRLDVITQGDFIKKDSAIKIFKVEKRKIIVELDK
jgi:membrane-bound ClpP family serine protease